MLQADVVFLRNKKTSLTSPKIVLAAIVLFEYMNVPLCSLQASTISSRLKAGDKRPIEEVVGELIAQLSVVATPAVHV